MFARVMRLTKLEHAALIIEQNGETLIIDPGSFTRPMTDVQSVVAVVITHEHADHWTAEQLTGILAGNAGARLLGPGGVVAATAAAGITVEQVDAGDTVTVGSFTLRFFGGRHAVIHESIPVVDNVGVLVNDRFYYAGDSFTIPDGVEVDTLAAPAGAPWMKVAETMDYAVAIGAKNVFPTHEMVLSRAGKDLSNGRLTWAAEQGGGTFHALEPGDTLDI